MAVAGSGARSDELGAPLLTALAGTGAIGSTVRQLADQLDRPAAHVSESLDDLRRRGRVVRMGRGLWILREYERLSVRSDFASPKSYLERFARETGRTLGTYDGPITFSRNDELPIHRWWPYVQGYSAEFVAGLLRRSGLRRGSTVLDPFAGSGTTLVESRRAGMRAIGIELLAPAALAARVKTRFELSATSLASAARSLVERAREAAPGPAPFLRETARQFHPRILHELRQIRTVLPTGDSGVDEALRLAFGSILIPVSHLRRSPCLGYGKPKDATASVDVFATFADAISRICADLDELHRARSSWGPPATVVQADARTARLAPQSVDLAVTSPPYVNGMDYVMNYKLDLAWLGFVGSYRDLAALRGTSVACDNLPRAALAEFRDPAHAVDEWLPPILREIETNVDRKGSYRRDDVHAVVARYFSDLAPVLRNVYEALRPGGAFVLVVGDSLLAGTYVPGDLILARMGESIGFEIESVEQARTRRSGQRRSFLLRESITTLRKPRRPRARTSDGRNRRLHR